VTVYSAYVRQTQDRTEALCNLNDDDDDDNFYNDAEVTADGRMLN